jgi:glutathione peroxidase-family protein
MRNLKDVFKEESIKDLAGENVQFSTLENNVVLFVNVASRCGLTPQYEGLVSLSKMTKEKGLIVIGVPCNQFGAQEPGTADEIQQFCSQNYGVDFPLLEKQDVNGGNRSPLYQWLVNSVPGKGDDISWNFAKFLVDRNGTVVQRFSPQVGPQDKELLLAIKGAL